MTHKFLPNYEQNRPYYADFVNKIVPQSVYVQNQTYGFTMHALQNLQCAQYLSAYLYSQLIEYTVFSVYSMSLLSFESTHLSTVSFQSTQWVHSL